MFIYIMELLDIQKRQEAFDEEHFKKFLKTSNDTQGLIRKLEKMVVALTGELGEFANMIKKISRDYETAREEPSENRMKNLKEEITDCFIYILIIANILNMDLEKEYFKKMSLNRQRFEKYKNNSKSE